MATDGGAILVKAIHNFKGTNNDELCFKKGDIITVTQMVDGGWWEGTLNGITGWFPSNYIREHKTDFVKSSKAPSGNQVDNISSATAKQEKMRLYHSMVFKDILDTEINHVNELQTLIRTYLQHLHCSEVMNERDWSMLVGNLEDVLDCHRTLVAALEEVKGKPSKEQRVGGVFMQMGPRIKSVHLTYCANHPKAVRVLERYKDGLNSYMESQGAPIPGILTLTTGLSRPFRRLEKYPALFQELQSHTEESHVDRGDTQRAVSVYRDIAVACQGMRRQKEMELEVMSSTIRDWEGEDIQNLGDILHMGAVIVVKEDGERNERYMVLFPNTLVMLSASPRMSAFIYKGKLPLSGVVVNKLDPETGYQHAFDVTGSMIQRIVVICQNNEEAEQWVCMLQQQMKNCGHSAPGTSAIKPGTLSHSSPAHPVPLQSGRVCNQPPPPHRYQRPASPIPLSSSGQKSYVKPLCQETKSSAGLPSCPRTWKMWSLRPHPPLRPCLSAASKDEIVLRRTNNWKKDKATEQKSHLDDMKILQVIEAYCTSAKTRYTVNSVLLDSPQVLIAEDEKIIVEDAQGSAAVVEEKSLVDTVYALKDQVKELKNETATLCKDLEGEKRARKKLEILLRKHVFAGKEDILAGLLED